MRKVALSMLLIVIGWFTLNSSIGATKNFNFANLELGITTYAQAKSLLGSKAKLTEAAADALSGGKVLRANGKLLKKGNAIEVVCVFDENDRVAGIDITVPAKMAQTLFSEISNGAAEVEGRPGAYQLGNGIAELHAPAGDSAIATVRLATLALDQMRYPAGKSQTSNYIIWGVSGAVALVLLTLMVKLLGGAKKHAPPVVTGTERSLDRPPTEFEQYLSSIRSHGQRAENLIMLGEPNIKERLYLYLDEVGKRCNGVITVSAKEAFRTYKRAAGDAGPEFRAVHVLDIRVKQHNLIKQLTEGSHKINVFVAGSEAVIEAKLREIGDVLLRLFHLQVFEDMSAICIEDGKLVLPSKLPITLNSSKRLSDLTIPATLVVSGWARKQQTIAVERKQAYEAALATGTVDPSLLPPDLFGTINADDGLPMSPEAEIYDIYGEVNPANGMPMIENTGIDVTGNSYGTSNY